MDLRIGGCRVGVSGMAGGFTRDQSPNSTQNTSVLVTTFSSSLLLLRPLNLLNRHGPAQGFSLVKALSFIFYPPATVACLGGSDSGSLRW